MDKIKDYKLSPDFEEMLEIFQGRGTEFFYEDLKEKEEEKRWMKKHF